MTFENELIEKIKTDRTTLKDSSLKIYLRNIKILNKKSGNENLDNLDFLKDKKKIDEILKHKSNHTIKTYFASIVVVLMATDAEEDLIDEYRVDMEKLLKHFDYEDQNQIKSESMDINWVDWSEILKIVNKLRKQIYYEKILEKDVLTNSERKLLDNWMIASLYTADADNNPPIRLGYAGMKIIKHFAYKKIKNPTENYLVIKNNKSKYFSFNNYKTDRSMGQTNIVIGKKLNNILNKYLEFHDLDIFC